MTSSSDLFQQYLTSSLNMDKKILCVSSHKIQDTKSLDKFKESKILIHEVSSYIDAIHRLEEESMMLVVVEQELQDLSGIELLQTIRQLWPHIFCVLLCDFERDPQVALKALQDRDCHALLSAPLNYSDLFRFLTVQEPISSALEGSDLVAKTLAEMPSFEILESQVFLEAKVKERTKQIELAKKEWEQAFDAMSDPVLIIGEDYRIMRGNLALASQVAGNIRDILGKPCYKMLMDRDKPCDLCPLHQTLENDAGHQVEIKHSNGEQLFHLRSFPLSGPFPKVIHEYRDITEEKWLQQKLMQADKLSSLGMLAGRVAHEVNNPLAAILAQSQLLLMDADPEDEELYTSLQEIEKAAHRCRKIVQDLLNFSRQRPTNLEAKHSLQDIIQQSIEFYNMLPPKNGPTLHVDIAKNLPLLRLDQDKLQSVFLNLLSNAKFATDETGDIWISAEKKDEEVLVTVKDNGYGIPEDIQKKVFLPFFTTKDRGLGTGLGLHIVTEIIKEHKGRIELTSKNKQGTEFKIYLPLLG